MRAHNKLVDQLGSFEEARRQLRWHYQYIVINDFLRRIVPAEVMDSILPQGVEIDWCEVCHPRFGHGLPFMPVAVLGGRVPLRPLDDSTGSTTSTPRSSTGPSSSPEVSAATAKTYVASSRCSKGGESTGRSSSRPATNVRSHPASSTHGSQRALLPCQTQFPEPRLPQPAAGRRAGTSLGGGGGEGVGRRAADRGRDRSRRAGLGRRVARDLQGATPLWFYVLREASKRSEGLRLGPIRVASWRRPLSAYSARDQFSYPNIEPAWTPAKVGLIPQKGDSFVMADLIRFATGTE